MSKSIPTGLNATHVMAALEDIDSGLEVPVGPPDGYELVYDGKRYPPKAVIGLAFQHFKGRILPSEGFDGGVGEGHACDVLRDLGFEVNAIAPRSPAEFIVSHGIRLDSTEEEMASEVWYHIWSNKLWPYRELEIGDTLYWIEAKSRAIVWRSKIQELIRFRFQDKQAIDTQLTRKFGEFERDEKYLKDKKDQGYCLAYRVSSLESLDIPKPAHITLPRDGWLRCTDPGAQEWFKDENWDPWQDGPYSQELRQLEKEGEASGNENVEDPTELRKRVLRSILERRWQSEFRELLIKAYSGRCAVTGCDAISALEAAHIVPYHRSLSNHVTNGLLLRADIHTLFDLELIGIDPETLRIKIAPEIQNTVYESIDGTKLQIPAQPAEHPSRDSLVERWKIFVDQGR